MSSTEILLINACPELEEIPFSFGDILTVKQIKLIRCDNKTLEASALKIKNDIEENEGCDRVDLITIEVTRNKLICVVFECVRASNFRNMIPGCRD
ncbi:hypothetical protein FXO37_19332 [Capsicum annuum]|nr:hypothetical protein FXO37_19332 [Capsicum annuum]